MPILDERINHVVVLMLENRSFDCLLGKLYPKTPAFDGLAGTETNDGAAGGPPVPVWNMPGPPDGGMTIPDPDPGELFIDMNTQIFGQANPVPGAAPTMRGFVQSYAVEAARHAGVAYDLRAVMHYFMPEQVPVLSRLARQFAVSDRWHASAPCQTWPNRFFVHTGTAGGLENNEPAQVPFTIRTIFTRFDGVGMAGGWKIYFHDMPQALALGDLWPHIGRFRLYPEFRADAAAGTLPAYSFIEPHYFTDYALPNDCHPPHVVTLAEGLIADVYNALRASPLWQQTLLIITCDEHGGCYDHVPPAAAVPPDQLAAGRPFAFDRYGVRVPAVLVSPFIRQGTVLRPPTGGPPFDHTSIIKMLRRRFNLGPPLTARDGAAPDLFDALHDGNVLPGPDNMGPDQLSPLSYSPAPSDLVAAQTARPNGMQTALHQMAFRVPAGLVLGGAMGSAVATPQQLVDVVRDVRIEFTRIFG